MLLLLVWIAYKWAYSYKLCLKYLNSLSLSLSPGLRACRCFKCRAVHKLCYGNVVGPSLRVKFTQSLCTSMCDGLCAPSSRELRETDWNFCVRLVAERDREREGASRCRLIRRLGNFVVGAGWFVWRYCTRLEEIDLYAELCVSLARHCDTIKSVYYMRIANMLKLRFYLNNGACASVHSILFKFVSIPQHT